jgi:D-glycero-D-manno-heptose 1,7-bisphosphate phosphatase
LSKALFLDRDGVINVDIGHAHRIDQIQFVDGIFDLVRRANNLSYVVIIVTNQAGIAKNMYSEAEFSSLSQWMVSEFSKQGAIIRDVVHCPHHPEATLVRYKQRCNCRKPEPGMLLQSNAKFHLNASQSVIVGDHYSDILAGHRAGLRDLYLLGSAENGVLAPQEIPESMRRISNLESIILL